MKTLKTILAAVFVLGMVVGSGTTAKAQADDAYYYFYVIDGVHTSKTKNAYVSKVIYYPGFDKAGAHFEDEASRAFSNYLKAYYNDAFPEGSIHRQYGTDHQPIKKSKSNSTYNMKTRDEANRKLQEWVIEQKGKRNRVIHTDFSFSKSN